MKFKKEVIFKIYIPIILFLISIIWKYLHIGVRDISIDEPFTIFYAQDSLVNILKLPTQNEPTPPLFMLILHFWIKLFGISAHSVRVLPILFNALTAVFIYLTGKKFFNFWSGITASTMFIFSTYHFFFGGDTRTYSMLCFATASSLYYLLSIHKNPEKLKYLVGFVISNLILIYGHYFGLLVVFIQFVISFFYFRNKKVFKRILIGLVLTGVLYLPMISILANQFFISKKGTWVTPPPNSEYIQQLKWFMNSGFGLNVVCIVLVVGIVFSIFTKIKKDQVRDLLILFLWWIVPYSIMFFISSRIPMFTNRYILFNSIGFYLFIGVGINYFFQKVRFIGPAISLVIVFIVWQHMYTGNFALRKIKETADYARSKVVANTAVIIYPHWADLGFMYYFDPDIFKSVNDYTEKLKDNNIFQAWGKIDTKPYIEENSPERIIFYQNNTPSIDPGNVLFNYLDSLYIQTDSVAFEGGTVISIFDSDKNLQ